MSCKIVYISQNYIQIKWTHIGTWWVYQLDCIVNDNQSKMHKNAVPTRKYFQMNLIVTNVYGYSRLMHFVICMGRGFTPTIENAIYLKASMEIFHDFDDIIFSGI